MWLHAGDGGRAQKNGSSAETRADKLVAVATTKDPKMLFSAMLPRAFLCLLWDITTKE